MVAKYLAGRDKDLRIDDALEHRIVDADTLLQRLSDTDVDDERRSLARARIERDAKGIG